MKRRFAGALFAILLSFPLVARAGDATLAESLFREGKALMQAHDYVHACPKLAESFRQEPGTGTLLALALCYEEQGKVASAWATYGDVAARSHAEGRLDREQVAREKVSTLEARLSKLVVVVPAATAAAPGFAITRDGRALPEAAWGSPMPVDPGEHAIEATAPGRSPWKQIVTMGADGDSQSVSVPELTLLATAPAVSSVTPAESQASSAHKTQRTLAVVAAAVGVVGVGVGTAFGISSMQKHKEAEQVCPGTCDTQAGVDLWNDARHAGNWSTAGFVVGALGLAGGAVLWFTAKAPNSSTSVRVGLGSVVASRSW